MIYLGVLIRDRKLCGKERKGVGGMLKHDQVYILYSLDSIDIHRWLGSPKHLLNIDGFIFRLMEICLKLDLIYQ